MVSATIDDVLSGDRHPHELPWPLWCLWSDGFHAGQNRMQPRLTRAERDADHWYYVANNPAQARAEHARTLQLAEIGRARKASGGRQ